MKKAVAFTLGRTGASVDAHQRATTRHDLLCAATRAIYAAATRSLRYIGHRGPAFSVTFNESHVVSITQAICDYRGLQKIEGPLFLGIDTHALSVPAFATTFEVLAANNVNVMIAGKDEYTPTPAISHAILTHNRDRTNSFADGIVITPSHNPPGYGGLKYNLPHDGPADTGITQWIERKANDYLDRNLRGVRRISYARALVAPTTHCHDFLGAYTSDMASVIDFDVVLTHVPGSGTPIDGIKAETASAWFAARASGTNDVYKIYAESFLGADHLNLVLKEVQTVVDDVLRESAE